MNCLGIDQTEIHDAELISTMPAPFTTQSARIEVFRPGTFTAMSGEEVTYSDDDLAAIADSYDPEVAPAPIVVGHPNADSPAYAWVKGFEWDADADRLYADIHEIAPAFSSAVKEGRYKRISMSFYKPEHSANPKAGTNYPKHVGFLGGAAPAVSGLQPVSFKGGDEDTITVEMADAAFRDVASIFTKMREFIIEHFGRESADEAVPGYLVNWIDDAANEPPSESEIYAQPQGSQIMPGKPAPTPSKPGSDDFAEREANLASREHRLAEQEAERANADNEAFADGLIADGKLVTGSKPKVLALLNSFSTDSDELSFADGETTAKEQPLTLLKDILSAQPKIVEFGETDLGDPPVDATDGEALADAAIAYQADMRAKGIDVSASDAVAFIENNQGSQS